MMDVDYLAQSLALIRQFKKMCVPFPFASLRSCRDLLDSSFSNVYFIPMHAGHHAGAGETSVNVREAVSVLLEFIV